MYMDGIRRAYGCFKISREHDPHGGNMRLNMNNI